METINRFRILLSAPSDVKDELTKVEEAVRQFNRTTGEIQKIMLDPKHWSTDSHPQAGDRPQELLNKQFIRECDAVIAVFGTRFGSPTGKYQSGTEEEIEEMLQAGKPVFLYFSEISKDLSTIDVEQLDKVKAFKQKYQNYGLYGTFKSIEDIERKVHGDLSLYFIKNQRQTEEVKTSAVVSSQSNLEISSQPKDEANPSTLLSYGITREDLKGVSQSMETSIHKKISQVIRMLPAKEVVPQLETTLKPMTEAIKAASIISQFNEANSILGRKIEVDSEVKSLISNYAKESLQVDLPDGFFQLAELRKNNFAGISGPFDIGPKYVGSEESQKKFGLICDIERDIQRQIGFEKWVQQLEGFKFVLPILKNTGGHFDEDISVDLYFPKDSVQLVGRLEVPEFEAMELVTEQLLPAIFKPKKTVDTDEYEDYPEKISRSFYIPDPLLRGKTVEERTKELKKEYLNWLRDGFVYAVQATNENQVVTCKFSYLRQHTSMFFPAPVLLKNDTEELSYRIRSKHSPKVFSGTLKII